VGKIKTIYVCNHTHTDIGFTDYQDICFRQHSAFVDQALDLIEATDDYPAEARYKWTCETTGPLLRHLRSANPTQVDRFKHWHERGRIDVAAMQYNLTPLLNVEQMHRSLYPLRALRDEYGLTVEAAMQDDVNGVSWLFADLLAELGVWFYTAAVNPIRGARPKPFPGAFWWEGPSGKRVLAWNGYHYLFGRSQAGLGNWDLVDRLLPRWVEQLEADETYPYDFLYCESTHPVRVDNGPPDPRMPEFVKRWNEEDRPFKLTFVTTSEFGTLLKERHGNAIGTQRGDWTDHWTDGPGSSAYETGVNRATHEILGCAEAIEAWLRSRQARHWDARRAAMTYENATLFDEHTWGAYSSSEAPDSLFTRAQWNRKSGFAYTAAMEAHDQLAGAARALAAPLGEPGPEGIFNLGDLDPAEAFKPSGIEELLVINTLPWERQVIVEEPEPRGGAAPLGILDCFFNRGSGWGGARPIPPVRRVAGTVPAMGYAFLPIAGIDPVDLKVGERTIENRHYRITVDPNSGGLAGFFDKDIGHDFAGKYEGWRPGQYVYEEVESDEGRLAIANIDFAHPDFFVGRKDTPWKRSVARKVTVGKPAINEGRVSIAVDIEAAGVRSARVVYGLDAGTKSLSVDWSLDKVHNPDPEAVFIAFPFNLERADFTIDLNGIPSRPNKDQLDGAAKDWYPLQRWVSVSDGQRGVTIAPLDAPLVHLGGITTGKWARTLEPEGPTIMSWAINNHWLVNFKSSQGGIIPLRYRLTTHDGPATPDASARFAAEAMVPPVVLRDIAPTGARSDSFFAVDPAAPVLATTKPGEEDGWVALRLQNLSRQAATADIAFKQAPRAARRSDPIEHAGEDLALEGGRLAVALAPLEISTVLLRF
jgi:alpha-mannosidase